MNNKKIDDTSEEKFLKNKAKRSSSTVSNQKNKKKSNSVFKILLKTALLVICLLLVLGAVWVAKNILWPLYIDTKVTGDNQHNDTFVTIEGDEVGRDTVKIDGKTEKKNYTFLATATDKAGSLTDVIMIANLTNDKDNPTVSILQIPRDTYVKISPSKLHFNANGTLSEKNFTGQTATLAIKINEVYFRGKNLAGNTINSLLKEIDGKSKAEIEEIIEGNDFKYLNADIEKLTKYASSSDKAERKSLDANIRRDFGLYYLEQLIFCYFKIPIDYHAQVNINGFRGIVNAIGGVDLYVKQSMHYDDPYQDLHIHINPGQQHLNGEKAEEFVRFRQYPLGDIQRLAAQKDFINAFLNKLLSFSTVTKIDDILEEIDDNLYTSISFDNLVRFANKALKMDLKNGFEIETIPGVGEYIHGISYFICDKDEAIKVINEKYNVFKNDFVDEDFKIIDDEILTASIPVSSTSSDNAEAADGVKSGDDEEETSPDRSDGNPEDENSTEDENIDADNEQSDNRSNEQDEDISENDAGSENEPDGAENPEGKSNAANSEDAPSGEDANEAEPSIDETPAEQEPTHNDNSHLLEEMLG